MTFQLKQMAKFPGTAPSLLWAQAGSCYLCEPLFLLIPEAGNSSQSEAGGRSGVM